MLIAHRHNRVRRTKHFQAAFLPSTDYFSSCFCSHGFFPLPRPFFRFAGTRHSSNTSNLTAPRYFAYRSRVRHDRVCLKSNTFGRLTEHFDAEADRKHYIFWFYFSRGIPTRWSRLTRLLRRTMDTCVTSASCCGQEQCGPNGKSLEEGSSVRVWATGNR